MKDEIILSRGGSKQRTIKVSELQIPDLWHLHLYLKQTDPEWANAVLETWHIAHNLKRAILEDIKSPYA